jgi:hypothetical protein
MIFGNHLLQKWLNGITRGVDFWFHHHQGMSLGKVMESANKDARKWPILPFDLSRDFIICKEILV